MEKQSILKSKVQRVLFLDYHNQQNGICYHDNKPNYPVNISGVGIPLIVIIIWKNKYKKRNHCKHIHIEHKRVNQISILLLCLNYYIV